jgi:hypothetical protein
MKKITMTIVAVSILTLFNCGNKVKYFHLGTNPVQGPMAADACEGLVKMARDTGSGAAYCSDAP